MSEFDEKLGAILGDQNAMSQIMALAQSLSGQDREIPDCGEEGEQEDCIDNRRQDTELLGALRPYLKPERQKKLDRMLEVLQLLRLLKSGG